MASTISESLRLAGVPRGAAVMVHAGFKGLSRAGLRAEDVVDELCDYLASGTLMMPTFTWKSVNPSQPIFSETASASQTGILSEVFRVGRAEARSLHPSHSVVARGDSSTFLGDHAKDDTPCSAASPFRHLVDADGWFMLIGVGFERLTLMHAAEEEVAVGNYLEPRERAETYTCVDRRGVAHTVRTRRHLRTPRDFPRFQRLLLVRGEVRADETFGVEILIGRARTTYDFVVEGLRADPRATLAAG